MLLYPETVEEKAIANTLVMCTNAGGTATYIENRHEFAVWVIDRPTNLRWTVNGSNLKLQVFHEVMKLNKLEGMTLEPSWFATLARPPAEVHLSLNPQVQTAWQSLSLLSGAVTDKAADLAEDALKRLLNKGSLSRKATVDCLFAGFGIGEQIMNASESRSPEEVIESGLGIFDNAKSCAKSIKAAEREGAITVEEIARETKFSTWRKTTRVMLNTIKVAKGIRIPLRVP